MCSLAHKLLGSFELSQPLELLELTEGAGLSALTVSAGFNYLKIFEYIGLVVALGSSNKLERLVATDNTSSKYLNLLVFCCSGVV